MAALLLLLLQVKADSQAGRQAGGKGWTGLGAQSLQGRAGQGWEAGNVIRNE